MQDFSPPSLKLVERLLARTEIVGECRLWRGPLDQCGYGRFRAGSQQLAHRVAYGCARGPVPDGFVLDHLCRNRACIRLSHLEPVTQAENVRRGKRLITHCPSGHAYDVVNTYWRTPTQRGCRACRLVQTRASQARRRAAA